jgi:hypothetical protein
MLREFKQITPRIFWLVSVTSLAVLLVVVAIPQWLSKQAGGSGSDRGQRRRR